jgi:predicted SAM-dependent methyltransferase
MISKLKKTIPLFINQVINPSKNPVPIYSNNNSSGLKIHIGSGSINLQGWINIDARKLPHIHLVTDNLKLEEFKDDSISEIYLCHVMEHLSFKESKALLKIFFLKLKSGGILRISVPDFKALVDVYLANGENLNQIKSALMGGQDYNYNYHKSIYDEKSLTNLLEQNSFTKILKWETKEDFGISLGDWSDGTFETKNGFIPISLNLKAIKQ